MPIFSFQFVWLQLAAVSLGHISSPSLKQLLDTWPFSLGRYLYSAIQFSSDERCGFLSSSPRHCSGGVFIASPLGMCCCTNSPVLTYQRQAAVLHPPARRQRITAWPGNTTRHKQWGLVQNNDGCCSLQIKAACGEHHVSAATSLHRS